MNFELILVVAVVAIALYVISIYNTLQSLKTRIKASVQEIGNQLKRQSSLIPNLEASVKGYMKHETDIFKMLTDARKSVAQAGESNSGKDVDVAAQKLSAVVPRLAVAIESNPELKADASVGKLMSELSDTSDKLTYSRRALIDLSQQYNEKLVTFPGNIIANAFGFKEEKGLVTAMEGAHVEVSEEETKDVKVSL